MAEPKDEKKVQQLYMQFQAINQQINELQKQVQMLEETIHEITESKKALDEISRQEKGKEILVPVASGIFAKAEIKEADEFIVNVGANTAVSKSAEDIQKILDKQMADIQKTQNEFIDNIHQLTINAKEIRTHLKGLLQE